MGSSNIPMEAYFAEFSTLYDTQQFIVMFT